MKNRGGCILTGGIAYVYLNRPSNKTKLECKYLSEGRREFKIIEAPYHLQKGDVIIKYSDDGAHKTAHEIQFIKKLDENSAKNNFVGVMSDMFRNKLVEQKHVEALKGA